MRSNILITVLKVTAFTAALLTAGMSSAADVYLRAESFVKNIPNNDGLGGMIPVPDVGFCAVRQHFHDLRSGELRPARRSMPMTTDGTLTRST